MDQVYQRIQHGKDTTYVINFWATWCAPCVEELPFFDRLAAQYKSQKLKILLISVDFKSKLNTSVVPFVKKNALKSQVFVLNEQDQQAYIDRIDPTWSGALPATLIIKNQTRKFFEKEFTYSELVEEYQKVK